MIENSLYYALACNTAFLFPWYQRLTTSRYTPQRPHLNTPSYGTRHRGLLEFKPFTCLYCATFWAALIGSLFIPLILGQAVTLRESIAPALCAPFVAELLNRFFKSLPITL